MLVQISDNKKVEKSKSWKIHTNFQTIKNLCDKLQKHKIVKKNLWLSVSNDAIRY